MFSVAQNDAAYVAYTQSVDHDCTRWNLSAKAEAFAVGFQHLTDGWDDDMVLVDAHLFCHNGIFSQMFILSVYRQDVLRLGQSHHQLLLILTGVTGNVYLVHLFIDDLCAQTHQLVDHAVDKLFVARNRSCGDDDKVIWGHLHLAVLAHCHAAQGGQRFALATGGNQHHLVKRQAVCHVDVHQNPARNLEVTQLDGGCHHVDHAAPGNRDLFVVLDCIVDNLLDAVDVGGKGCNDDAAVACHLEQLIERFAHCALARGAARHFDVGGVRQQRQNALTAKLTKASQVDDTAFNRGVVYLKVAGLYDNASRSVDSKCAGIGNRVVDADKFHRHTACLDGVSGFDLHHLDLIAQSMLLELIFDKT